jgi:hypothetical protein
MFIGSPLKSGKKVPLAFLAHFIVGCSMVNPHKYFSFKNAIKVKQKKS